MFKAIGVLKMKNKLFKTVILSVSLAALMAACVPSQQTGTSYSRAEARAVQTVKLGRVVQASPVTIEGTKSGIGGFVGGAVGGLAGASVDNGIGGEIAAVIVGTAGAIIGAKAEEASTRAQGMEYTIRLDAGEVISIVQAVDAGTEPIAAGDEVKLLSQGGTIRVSKLGYQSH
jgi:outer membrane lipoprotein SlyB